MLGEFLPFTFEIDTIAIAGTALWSLALYLGFSPVTTWVMEQLNRWFNFAERSLYTSDAAFERDRPVREALNSFYASVCSIVPFLFAGALCNSGIEVGLGGSWAISLGMVACMGCGVYELGRRDGEASK